MHAQIDTFFEVFEHAPFGVFVLDAQFRLYQANAASRKIAGNIHPLIGRDFTEILNAICPGSFAAGIMGHIRQTLASGEAYNALNSMEKRRDTGTLEANDWRVERITLPDGQFGAACYLYNFTDRQNADEEGRALAARRAEQSRTFDRVLKSITDFAYIFDLEGRFIFANKPLLDLWGLTLEQAVGKNFFDLKYPDDLAAKLQRQIQQVIETRELLTDETPYTSPTGVAGCYQYIFSPVMGLDGRVEAVAGSTRDISEHKRAEENLRMHRELLDTVVHHLDVGAALIRGSDLRYKIVNEAYQAISPGREMAGKTIYETWPETNPDFSERCKKVLETGQPFEAEDEPFHIHRIAGGPLEQVYFSWSLHRVRLPGDEGWGILVSAWETTGRKHIEEALRNSEARFRAAVGVVSSLIWTNNADGRMEGEQPGWGNFTGQTYEEYQGFGWSNAVHPEDAQPTIDAWNLAVAEKRVFVFEHRVRRKDGQWRRFSLRATPVLDAAGSIREWVGIHTDITEQRKAEQALKDADRRKDEFLATLAHELRNPLAPIRNAAQIIKHAAPKDKTLMAAQAVIDRQLRQMTHLIDDLLDVSRITGGKIELRKQDVTLAAVIERAIETSRPNIDCEGHTLSVALSGEPIYLHADPVRLEQVFANLLNNACKYTQNGGQIRLSVVKEKNTVAVIIKDNGIGIPAEHLPRLFEMFAQVDTSLNRAQGGLGIGLALVRGLVQLHGGSVTASSSGEGKGSEFVVRLPILAQAPLPPEETKKPLETPAQARRILIVDDNEDIAESLMMFLQYAGHEVEAAFDGAEGIKVAERFRPEVVLMDIGMPNLDGYATCRRLREQTWGRDMMLIAQTGWGAETDREKTKAAGFDAHLVKPVDPDVLIRAIAKLKA